MKKVQAAHILTLIVDNEFGVLTRITAQIRREGWNIKSLAVAECINPAQSRITLTLECFDTTLPNVIYRLSRLACVRTVSACEPQVHVCREMMVAAVPNAIAAEAAAIAAEHGAVRIQERGEDTIFELAGDPERLDALSAALCALGAVNVVRTGPIVLE